MIGRDQGVEVNHLPGRLVTPRHLHPRGPPTDRALRGRLLRKLLEQIRSRHRRLSTSNAIAGNQISVETATGKNSHPLSGNKVTPVTLFNRLLSIVMHLGQERGTALHLLKHDT